MACVDKDINEATHYKSNLQNSITCGGTDDLVSDGSGSDLISAHYALKASLTCGHASLTFDHVPLERKSATYSFATLTLLHSGEDITNTELVCTNNITMSMWRV